MKEIWKDKKDYERLYQVSNLSRVKSLNYNHTGKEKIMKQYYDSNGYKIICLCKNNIKTTFFVHRLVAEAFLEIPEELRHLEGTRYLQVNHKDEDKNNNNIDNLEWCDAKYNTNFGTCIERRSKKTSKTVLQYTLDGEFVREWESTMQAEREGGFSHTLVGKCCQGKRKTHKGFIWRYK